jgi:hypothetical protein
MEPTPQVEAVPPASPVFVPLWLAPSDVSDWLTQSGAAPADMDRITRVCAAVEPQVQDARPDRWVYPVPPAALLRAAREAAVPLAVEGTYVPDAEVYQAAVQLAARVVRRRNSPGGLESMAESVMYVSKWDPDIQRALRQGPWRRAQVG